MPASGLYSYELSEIYILLSNNIIIDIRDSFVSIELHESIFYPIMTGSLVFRDGLSVFLNAPLIGEETVVIKFKEIVDDENIREVRKRFQISAIEKVVVDEGINTNDIVLYLESYVAKSNISKKISRSYINKNNVNIVRNILFKDIGFTEDEYNKFYYDETKYVNSFIANYWEPFEIINYVAEKSISKKTDGRGFLFFESMNGFNFRSISDMVAEEPYTKFENLRKLLLQNQNIKNSIENIEFERNKDINNMSDNGLFGSTLFTYDPLNKKYTRVSFEVEKEFEKRSKNGLGKYWRDGRNFSKDNVHFYNVNIEKLYTSGNLYNDEINLQKTIADKFLLTNLIIANIEVPGSVMMNCGKSITLDYYTKSQNAIAEGMMEINSYYSGKYLILNCTHCITPISYKCTAKISKNAHENILR